MKTSLPQVLGLASIVLLLSHSTAAQSEEKNLRWILNGPAIANFTTDPTAQAFFANTHPIVVAPKSRNAVIPNSWGALRTRIFPSYISFERAVKNGKIDPDIKAVLYDNEGWNLTPQREQQNFAQYAQQFYELAHQHGYFVIQTPAINLATPQQSAGERRFDTFVRLRYPENAAKYADAIDLQVQGSQVPPSTYAQYVTAAAKQAHEANPKVLVFAGLSTNPSGHSVTAEQIVQAIDATRTIVDGYWFNVPQQGPSCPNCNDFRPDMAIDVLRMLQSQHVR